MSNSPHSASTRDASPVSALVFFALAVIAGGGAANVYYHQPMLGQLLTALLASVFALVREEPILRWVTLTQGCNFAAFNAFNDFWACLVLHLGAAPFHLGSASAGLLGLVFAAAIGRWLCVDCGGSARCARLQVIYVESGSPSCRLAAGV